MRNEQLLSIVGNDIIDRLFTIIFYLIQDEKSRRIIRKVNVAFHAENAKLNNCLRDSFHAQYLARKEAGIESVYSSQSSTSSNCIKDIVISSAI